MDVYLVPAGPTRYALYCEVAFAPPTDGEPTPLSWWGRRVASFRRAIDEGEAEARGGGPGPESRSRFRRFVTRKLAEAVAEQRLLWHLRQETQATLIHPDTLPSDRALEIARAEFAVDYARHRRWLFIDALAAAITGPVLFFVPGPNLVSWYFSFRAIGHYFSMKGASQGLHVTQFTPRPNADLSTVAAALSADPDTRRSRVTAAAHALGLDRLPSFVDRICERA